MSNTREAAGAQQAGTAGSVSLAGLAGRAAPAAVRVVIIDDQAEFLSWVRNELERNGGFSVVGQSLQPERALALAKEHQPDLLLVDFDMPGMNGIEVIRQVREHAPSVPTILMSLNDNRVFDVLARTAGALGFVPKERFSAAEIRGLLDTQTVGGA
jgi:DNA-binding NarL/FixJ family response regulator